MTAAELRRPDGTTIAYDFAGAGPPVVFVHGLTNRRTAWDPVTDRLTEDFSCVRIDLRGHGDSSTSADYGMLSLVSDVHAVVEEMGLEAPALVGHSLGGSVAAVYAAAHPVRAAVVVDQPLRFGDFAQRIRPYAERLRGPDCMRAVVEIDHDLGLEPYAGIAELERRVLAFPPEVIRGIWQALLTTPPHQLTEVAEAVLPRIAAPLLSVHGAQPPEGYAAWLTGLVPSAEVEVWDGTGHILHLVDPDRFTQRLGMFLAR